MRRARAISVAPISWAEKVGGGALMKTAFSSAMRFSATRLPVAVAKRSRGRGARSGIGGEQVVEDGDGRMAAEQDLPFRRVVAQGQTVRAGPADEADLVDETPEFPGDSLHLGGRDLGERIDADHAGRVAVGIRGGEGIEFLEAK